jgi:hypothetical protein
MSFPLSISFHLGSSFSNITCVMSNRPFGGCRSETLSHPIDKMMMMMMMIIIIIINNSVL